MKRLASLAHPRKRRTVVSGMLNREKPLSSSAVRGPGRTLVNGKRDVERRPRMHVGEAGSRSAASSKDLAESIARLGMSCAMEKRGFLSTT